MTVVFFILKIKEKKEFIPFAILFCYLFKALHYRYKTLNVFQILLKVLKTVPTFLQGTLLQNINFRTKKSVHVFK